MAREEQSKKLSGKELESYKLATKWLKELDFVREHKRQIEFERQGEKIVKNYLNQSLTGGTQADTPRSRQRIL